jgi:hypothetical protein
LIEHLEAFGARQQMVLQLGQSLFARHLHASLILGPRESGALTEQQHLSEKAKSLVATTSSVFRTAHDHRESKIAQFLSLYRFRVNLGSMRLTHKITVFEHKLCTRFWSNKLSHKKDKIECFKHRFSK